MIIQDANVKGLKTDLYHLDQTAEKLGFVRWQWEYYRATYDAKFVDSTGDYYLRFNVRATSGKLENPETELVLEDAYIGRATFPHGLDYSSEVPANILKAARQKLADLRKALNG
ncbi:YugN family protein [Paenibacillus thermoaerophilus]|uniref:YugN family protein n=1 Tax=Paenibacillus thermoaerophilus TaxID=1215385 RepID=A0ABW2UXV0_9BACL|nr:YugN family protein [Paenibacillus thermoaerophilus]TMV19126.1 hypothetical protein FE781_01045 [Paenibacillus thermoaerophilus]